MRVSRFEQYRRCFRHFPFIRSPRPPTAKEAEINECSNYVWPDLSFGRLRSGQESVHVNVDHIAKGTLFPFGGQLCTHWEYLAATSAEPASVSARIRIEDFDLDGCPLWYVYSGVAKPTYFSSALVREGSVWVEGGRSKLLDRLVSFAPPEDEFASSARFLYRATRQLNRGTRLCGPPTQGVLYRSYVGEGSYCGGWPGQFLCRLLL